MSYENHGSQSGDGSINVGAGDFRGAQIHVNGSGKPVFTPQQMGIVRHQAMGGRCVQGETLTTFGLVTGIASLIGLYFTLFQAFPQAKYSSWSTLFMLLFILGVFTFVISAVLKRKKFEHVFRAYYLEYGKKDTIQLSSFTAVCPWCNAKMHLENVGPKDGPRDDIFICERNSRQHTILLDPTVLPEIDE